LTGIGFLGAGVIVRSRFTVFGLTTAAGIWTVAIIGLALGSRHYALAFALYVIIIGSLWLLRYLEPILPRETFRQINLRMRGDGLTVEEARAFFARYRLALERIAIEKNKQSRTANYTFVVRGKRREEFIEAFNALLQREDVRSGQLLQQEQQAPEETNESSNT
jgi:putative Mg2+ transporter-C (MgtC) family protein